jgi:hypothetical protein
MYECFVTKTFLTTVILPLCFVSVHIVQNGRLCLCLAIDKYIAYPMMMGAIV